MEYQNYKPSQREDITPKHLRDAERSQIIIPENLRLIVDIWTDGCMNIWQ